MKARKKVKWFEARVRELGYLEAFIQNTNKGSGRGSYKKYIQEVTRKDGLDVYSMVSGAFIWSSYDSKPGNPDDWREIAKRLKSEYNNEDTKKTEESSEERPF